MCSPGLQVEDGGTLEITRASLADIFRSMMI
jgi:hypothetical protein